MSDWKEMLRNLIQENNGAPHRKRVVAIPFVIDDRLTPEEIEAFFKEVSSIIDRVDSRSMMSRDRVIHQINLAITLLDREVAKADADEEADMAEMYRDDRENWKAILVKAQEGASGKELSKAISNMDTAARDWLWSDLNSLESDELNAFLESE